MSKLEKLQAMHKQPWTFSLDEGLALQNYERRCQAKAPELVEALRKLVAWESDPDKASSDAADIAAEARSLLAEIDGQ